MKANIIVPEFEDNRPHDVERIPHELRPYPQWVGWKIVNVTSGSGRRTTCRRTKQPIDWHRGSATASVTEPKEWTSFEHARERSNHYQFYGMGFVFTADDPYVGIDLDKCRNPETGVIEPWALAIVEAFGTYTEPSPSGTGVHIIGRGIIPGDRNRTGQIEMYDRGRFFTMSGNPLDGYGQITDCQDALDTFYAETFPARSPATPRPPSLALSLDDREIVDAASRINPKFTGLWSGDAGGYPSHSEARSALVYILAGYAKDPAQLERLFQSSGLYREDKWPREKQKLIDAALRDVTWQYEPPQTRPAVANIPTTQNGNGMHDQRGSSEIPPTEPHVPAQEPRVFANTDTGNSERLVALHGSKIRFNWGRNVWHVWSGRHWEEDRAGRMEQLAKATARAIPDEARHLTGEEYTRALKWAASSESSGKRQATVDLARSEDGVPVQPHELDADPWLLNVSNGTLNLRDGTLRPHQLEDLITRVIDVPYDPDATCPLFLAFLNRIFDRDEALIDYVQRIVGYSCTGSIREQMVVIAFGPGSNGKSTLIGILRRLLGDYAREADADSFMERKTESIREDIADLDGARFVSASETADGKRLSEALVKKMTGGERLRARRLYENGYEFMPQFKVWLSTNHRPEIRGAEHAIWRRIRLVPFTVTIAETEKDSDLPEKLATELPGILAWAVRGCMDWQRDGLNEPAAVLRATSEYRRDMDLIANWLEDRCELRRGVRETPKALYEDYVTYCEASGDTPLKQRTFGVKLSSQGCGEEKINNVRYRTGIRLRDPDRPDQTTFDASGTQGTQGTQGSGKPPRNSVTRDLPEPNVPNVPYVPDEEQAPFQADLPAQSPLVEVDPHCWACGSTLYESDETSLCRSCEGGNE